MTFNIVHQTTYDYTAPVAVSHHVARLEPRETPCQRRERFSLKIFPEPAIRRERHDYFGNPLCVFSIQEEHERLQVLTHSRVTVSRAEGGAPEPSLEWESAAAMFRDPVAQEVVGPYQFVFDSPQIRTSPDFADYARQSFRPGTPLLAAARDLTARLFKDFRYDPKATTVATPPEQVWRERRGVCQDFAHLAIACVRSMGLAARYVSGYLRTVPAPGAARLVGADASHAWFSIYCHGIGWVDFDPTNNLQPAEEHITVAIGRDFGDVSPVAGILTGGGEHQVKVSVDVSEAAE